MSQLMKVGNHWFPVSSDFFKLNSHWFGVEKKFYKLGGHWFDVSTTHSLRPYQVHVLYNDDIESIYDFDSLKQLVESLSTVKRELEHKPYSINIIYEGE